MVKDNNEGGGDGFPIELGMTFLFVGNDSEGKLRDKQG